MFAYLRTKNVQRMFEAQSWEKDIGMLWDEKNQYSYQKSVYMKSKRI